VHEPDIAPLARRLAEENNVDWRRLSGSGDGGRVVERDVLGYLARVMAGDEAIDPTPEPVPEGMVAWPEDDVNAYRARAHEPPESSPPTLDDELFLFDDPLPDRADERVEAAPPEPWPSIAGSRVDAVDAGGGAASDDDAVLLMGDDDGPGALAPGLDGRGADAAPIDVVRFDELQDLGEPAAPAADDGEPVAPAADDEDALLVGAGADDGLPDLFATGGGFDDAVAKGAVPDLLFEDEGSLGEALVGESVGGNGELRLDDPEDARTDDHPEDAFEDAAWDGSDGAGAPDHDEHASTRTADLPPATAVDGAIQVAPAAPIVAPPAPAAAPGIAFLRHGQVWRRRFDDRPLRTAVSEVAAELGVAPSAVAAVLLARAALCAGVVASRVAAMSWRNGALVRGTVDVAGDLRAAIRSVERAEDGASEEAALVVADLSDLDLDEAVLHLGAPVLTLGRASGGGTWLCLTGDEVDASVVNGLARSAELLAAPVRLLI
jgi:hypothetical protein